MLQLTSTTGIERCVGAADDRLNRIPALELGQAHAYRGARVQLAQLPRRNTETSLSAPKIGARKGAHELVSSVANNEIVRPKTGSERRYEIAKELVTGGVPVRVVDCLETVDIDEGDHEPAARSPGSVDLAIDIDQPAIPPKRSRQVVEAGTLAIAGGEFPVVSRLRSVACRVLAIPRCLRALARRPQVMRAIPNVGRPVARVGRPVALLREAIALVGLARRGNRVVRPVLSVRCHRRPLYP